MSLSTLVMAGRWLVTFGLPLAAVKLGPRLWRSQAYRRGIVR